MRMKTDTVYIVAIATFSLGILLVGIFWLEDAISSTPAPTTAP